MIYLTLSQVLIIFASKLELSDREDHRIVIFLLSERVGVCEYNWIEFVAYFTKREELSIWQLNRDIITHSSLISIFATEYDLGCNNLKVIWSLAKLNLKEGKAKSVNLCVNIGQASIGARDLCQFVRLAQDLCL